MRALCTLAVSVAITATLSAQTPPAYVPPRFLRGDLPPVSPPNVVAGGEVLIEAIVDQRGALTRPIVLRSTPPFTNMVLDAVGRWNFKPAEALRPDSSVGPVEAAILIAAVYRPPQLANGPTLGEPPKDISKPSTDVAYPVSVVTPSYPPQAASGLNASVVLYRSVSRRAWKDHHCARRRQRPRIRRRIARRADAVELPSVDIQGPARTRRRVRAVRIRRARPFTALQNTRRPTAPVRTLTSTEKESRQQKRAFWAWVAVCISWGTTFLAARIAIESYPPLLMAGTRQAVAGLILVAFVRTRGIKLPPRDSWAGHALLGALMIGAGNGFLVWAQQFVPSGIAAVMVSVIPFWMVGVEALMPGGERLRGRHLSGLLIGFSGIVLLIGSGVQAGGRRRPAVPARSHCTAVLLLRLGCWIDVCQAAQARRESCWPQPRCRFFWRPAADAASARPSVNGRSGITRRAAPWRWSICSSSGRSSATSATRTR